MEPKV